jgi:SAM-dependent methyltransferase
VTAAFEQAAAQSKRTALRSQADVRYSMGSLFAEHNVDELIEKVRRGERWTPEQANRFLVAFHARHPSCTPSVLAGHHTVAGLSSYAMLADRVPREGQGTVVDLACGDGELTRALARHVAPSTSILGVDMSEAELDAARVHGVPPNVRFELARADAIPLPPGVARAIACHYGIMLMRPIETVIAEIARVLTPGGVFTAAISSRGGPARAIPELWALVTELLRTDVPRYPDFGIGDSRLYSDAGFAALFSERAGFAPPTVERHGVRMREPPERIVESLRLLYWYDLLSEASLARLDREMLPLLRAHADADGNVPHEYELVFFVSRRLTPGPT